MTLRAKTRPRRSWVKLRYFVGLTMDEAAAALGIAKRTAESLWTYARVWLHRQIRLKR